MRKAMLVMCVLALGTTAALAQGNSVGTWKLNVAKSNFGKRPAPKSATLTITDDSATAMKWSYIEVGGDGKTMKVTYNGAPDGKPHPPRKVMRSISHGPWPTAARRKRPSR